LHLIKYAGWQKVSNQLRRRNIYAHIIGKLKVTPIASRVGNSSPNFLTPSSTTSATQSPIQAKRSSAFSFFRCSPMGHDFSRIRLTRDFSSLDSSEIPLLMGGSEASPLISANSMKPTRRLVPPTSMARYLPQP
jgi:hypothetical protein